MNGNSSHDIQTSPRRLTLIDGSGFIFRAFYAMPSLTRADGTPVGAVYGFVNMMLKILRDRMNDAVEDYIAVVFDAGRVSFRNEKYPEYKANRAETPEELVPQFSIVKEATRALNLPVIEVEGVEADDVIASYTKQAKLQEMEVIIVSSDKDLMQLVDDAAGVFMFDAMKDRLINDAAVCAKFGVAPKQVRDVLSLIGDNADNIPGIPGIGPKTAAQLIGEYGNLDNLLANATEIKQNKRRENLIKFADDARLSYELIGLRDDLQLPQPIEALRLRMIDADKLVDFAQQMGFKRIVERFNEKAGSGTIGSETVTDADKNTQDNNCADNKIKPQYQLINTEEQLHSWIADIWEAAVVAISLEIDADRLIGVAISLPDARAAYIPIGHTKPVSDDSASKHRDGHDDDGTGNDLFAFNNMLLKSNNLVAGQLAQDIVLNAISGLLADQAICKISWCSKEDIKFLAGLDIKLQPVDDVILLDYCLHAGLYKHDFGAIIRRELGLDLANESELLGTGKSKITISQADMSITKDFAAQKADYTLRLWQKLKPQLQTNKLLTVYERLERPLLFVLAGMELAGVKLDSEYLQRLTTEFTAAMDKLSADIYQLAGREFVIGSPKQLGEILFEEMGLTSGKKSKKTGNYSTSVEILEELAVNGHIIADKVLQWRQYDKLRSTYSEALAKQINPLTGRVHTTFQQTITITGRLSSADPNLQNIPIRTEQGKRIRKAFIAQEGYKLLAADYSQIELRLLAEFADIDVLKQAFLEGKDIHSATASQMFGVPLEEVTADLRRSAKMINFGIIYGISAHGLAIRLGIDRAQAASFIKSYFEHYPGIRAYMEAKKLEAQENGYVTTIFGRKVHIAAINDSNHARRAFAQRQAINAPLQGSAADIIKRAMIHVSDILAGAEQECRLLLQVHDELVFEVQNDVVDEYAAKIRKIMEHAAHLSVPLTVDIGIGDNWGDLR